MKLFQATIICQLRVFAANLHDKDTVYTFIHAIAAESKEKAALDLEKTFPWTYYKNVSISWEQIGGRK